MFIVLPPLKTTATCSVLRCSTRESCACIYEQNACRYIHTYIYISTSTEDDSHLLGTAVHDWRYVPFRRQFSLFPVKNAQCGLVS